MIFTKVSSVDDWRQLHGLFMYCCKSESAAKVVQPQHRLIPALVVLWALVVLEMAHQGTWLKLTGVPWMALVALQWWQAHTKYRHFQPIWTQSQHRTPICTLIRLLKCLLKLSMGSFLLCLEYASCTSSSTTDVSNRPVIGSIPLLLLCTLTWNSCLHDSVVVYNFCMLLSWSLDFVLASIYSMACNLQTTLQLTKLTVMCLQLKFYQLRNSPRWNGTLYLYPDACDGLRQ